MLLTEGYYIEGYYSIFKLFWGATNQDLLLTETCSCSRLYGRQNIKKSASVWITCYKSLVAIAMEGAIFFVRVNNHKVFHGEIIGSVISI